MKRLFILPAILCAAALVFSCVQPKEEEKVPTVLKISPEKTENEAWLGHEIQFKVVCDLDVEINLKDTPWATITATDQTGNGQTTVKIQLEDNPGDDPRTGCLEVVCGKTGISAEFSQLALGSTMGIWNYDGRGANIEFDDLTFQSSVRRYPDGTRDARLLDMVNGTYLVIKGLPSSPAVGSTITVPVQQNMLKIFPWQYEAKFNVIRTGEGKLWLGDLGTVYIVRI